MESSVSSKAQSVFTCVGLGMAFADGLYTAVAALTFANPRITDHFYSYVFFSYPMMVLSQPLGIPGILSNNLCMDRVPARGV